MHTTTLRFTSQEISAIAEALGELPYKTAAPILDSIVEQIRTAAQKRDAKNARQ